MSMQIKLVLKNTIILDTSTDWVKELLNDQLNDEGLTLETASVDSVYDAARAILENDMGQLIDFDSITADDWEITVSPNSTTELKSEGQV